MTRRALYIEWGEHGRSVEVAEGLGAKLVVLRWRTTNWLTTSIRYMVQFGQTLVLLVRERPEVVISHHTQPFCSAASLIYCRIRGADLVTDCHDGAFLDSRWRRFPIGALNRAIFRRARVNLVHHSRILSHVVDELGLPGRFEVLHNAVPPSPCHSAAVPEPATVVFICSFGADEPIGAIFGAAARLPDARCMVTGRPDQRILRDLGDLAPNLTLTGYLPAEAFDALVCTATVAVALSTRENVLMQACHEVMASGRPLVTSSNDAARAYLTSGTVFVENTAGGIAAGVQKAFQQESSLASEMAGLASKRDAQWKERAAELRHELGLG